MVRPFPGSPSRRAARFRHLPICGKRRASGTDVSNGARPHPNTGLSAALIPLQAAQRPRSRSAFLMTDSASGATVHRPRLNQRPKQSIEHEPAFRSAPRFARGRVARRRMSRGKRRLIEFKICLVILAICPFILHQIRAGIPRKEARQSPVFRGFPAFTRFFLINACPAVFLLACLYRQIPEASCRPKG